VQHRCVRGQGGPRAGVGAEAAEHDVVAGAGGDRVVAADTDDEARLLATSGRESFASLRRGTPIALPPPNPAFEKDVVPFGRLPLAEVTSIAMVGSPATVREGIRAFVAQTTPDELMIVSHIYDHAARVRSYEIADSIAS